MLLLQEEGHLISSCFEKWRVAQKQNSVEPKPNGFISKPLPLYDVSEDTPPQDPRKTIRVQCHCQVSNSIPIKILRDSGASQSTVEWHFGVIWEVVHWCEWSVSYIVMHRAWLHFLLHIFSPKCVSIFKSYGDLPALRRKRVFNIPFCKTNQLKNSFIMYSTTIS